MTHTGAVDTTATIAIIGAGPAGLATAWFLRKHGYRNVTVLEKAGEIGGLCKSITVDGLSYDLGANYVTWAYQETLKIADEVGATTYAEKPYTSIDIQPRNPPTYTYRSLDEAVLWDPYTNTTIKRWTFLRAAIRYVWTRWWDLGAIIDAPDYLDNIDSHPELCVSFAAWLKTNDMVALTSMFQFPITIMGYGQLENIVAPYALRYMSVRTVIPMVFSFHPIGWIIGWTIGSWPRRFTDGFQRLWERVSWRINVRLNVNITKVTRSTAGIQIDMEYPEQDLDKTTIVKDTKYYDYLVLACPLTKDVFGRLGLVPNTAEKRVNDEIKINPYCMTTFWIEMKMPEPIAPVLPLTPQGTPWAVARQFQHKGSLFTQFYTRPKGQDRDGVITDVRSLVAALHGTIDTTQQTHWHTYDKFTYFQHFTVDQIQNGIYTHLARMQGGDKTFYVGGATDFELVEPIVVHAKHIVKKHFVGAAT